MIVQKERGSFGGYIQRQLFQNRELAVEAKLRRWRRVAERQKWDLLFAFLDYHKKNPDIFDRFCKQALFFIGKDFHMSHKDILRNLCYQANVEAVIRDDIITTEGEQRVKLNNGYHAFYVRLFYAKHPEHRGFFKLRKMRMGAGYKQRGIEK